MDPDVRSTPSPIRKNPGLCVCSWMIHESFKVFEEKCLQMTGTSADIERFITPSPRSSPTHRETPSTDAPLEPFQTVLSLLRDAAEMFRSRQLRPGAADGLGSEALPLDSAILFGTIDAAEAPSVSEVGELNDLMDDGPVQVQEAAMLCVSRLCTTRGWPMLATFLPCGLVDEILVAICLASRSSVREAVGAKAADVLTAVLDALCWGNSDTHGETGDTADPSDRIPRIAAAQRLSAERIATAGLPVLVGTLCLCIETGRVGPLALSTARACNAAAKVPTSVYVGGESMQSRLLALLSEQNRMATLLSVTAGTPLGMRMVGECHGLVQSLLEADPAAERALFSDVVSIARLVDQLVTGLCVQRRYAVRTLSALCSTPAGINRLFTAMIPALGPALLHAVANPVCGPLRAECASVLVDLLNPSMRSREKKHGSVTERHMLVLRVVQIKPLAGAAAASLRMSIGLPEVLLPKVQLMRLLSTLELDGRLLYTDKYLKPRQSFVAVFESVGPTIAREFTRIGAVTTLETFLGTAPNLSPPAQPKLILAIEEAYRSITARAAVRKRTSGAAAGAAAVTSTGTTDVDPTALKTPVFLRALAPSVDCSVEKQRDEALRGVHALLGRHRETASVDAFDAIGPSLCRVIAHEPDGPRRNLAVELLRNLATGHAYVPEALHKATDTAFWANLLSRGTVGGGGSADDSDSANTSVKQSQTAAAAPRRVSVVTVEDAVFDLAKVVSRSCSAATETLRGLGYPQRYVKAKANEGGLWGARWSSLENLDSFSTDEASSPERQTKKSLRATKSLSHVGLGSKMAPRQSSATTRRSAGQSTSTLNPKNTRKLPPIAPACAAAPTRNDGFRAELKRLGSKDV